MKSSTGGVAGDLIYFIYQPRSWPTQKISSRGGRCQREKLVIGFRPPCLHASLRDTLQLLPEAD